MARSVAGDPKVLLLDEPFSGLDEELRDDMRTTVRDIHDKLGLTTMMITHDADEALMMSDRIAYLTKGKIVQFCAPTELYSHPATAEVAACFGDCLRLSGKVTDGTFSSPALTCVADCQDGPALAIARCKGLSLVADPSGVPVVDCSFRGEQYYTSIQIDADKQSLYSDNRFEVGDSVALEASSGSVFVFPA